MKTIEDKTAKSLPVKRHPLPQAQFAVGFANILLPLLYRSEKHPQVIHWWWWSGVLMAAFCLPPYILFSSTVCAQTLCTNRSWERLQITQMYAERCGSQHLPPELEGAPQVDTPQWALSWRTQNHPNRSPVQACQDPTTPRRPRLQENGGSALGTTWKPGAASLPRSLGEVGLLSGRCVSRNLCSPAKPIVAAGLPWRLQLLPPQRWRQFWARGAFGSGRRAPGKQVPGSPPRLNAQAGSPG